jgi:hypothetical protein
MFFPGHLRAHQRLGSNPGGPLGGCRKARTPKQQEQGEQRKVIALHRSVAATSLGWRDFTEGTRRTVHADPDGRK